MNKTEIAFIVLIIVGVALVAYFMGYGKGAFNTFKFVINTAPDLLDIKLNDKAMGFLAGNPMILKQVLTIEGLEQFKEAKDISAELKGGIGPDKYGARPISEGFYSVSDGQSTGSG